jgi:cytidine deaminase
MWFFHRRAAPGEGPLSGTKAQITSALTTAERQRLLDIARAALNRAYAPYSKFRVGCALLTESGNTYAGCNVENASYGLTICAERAAICAAVAAEGERMKIAALAVLNGDDVPCSPCVACRQVIYEFGPRAAILYQGKHGVEESLAAELLPAGFTLL